MAFKLNNGNGSFTLPPVNVYVCFVIYLLSLCLSVCLSSLYKLVQDICLLVFILSCSSSPLFLLSVHAMHFCASSLFISSVLSVFALPLCLCVPIPCFYHLNESFVFLLTSYLILLLPDRYMNDFSFKFSFK